MFKLSLFVFIERASLTIFRSLHSQVTLLYSITTVCVDRSWLLGHTSTIKRLADTASSKFSVYDPAMHTKLCVALAAANVCPAADW